jgi:uncharacterized protein YjiS (DUF1127 family)
MAVTREFPYTETTGSWHGISGITSRVVAAVRAAHARREARRAYRQLLECDEHILKDIGVTRGDVREALTSCR